MQRGRRRLTGLTAIGLTTVLTAIGISACGPSSPLSKNVTLHMVAADYGDPKLGTSSATYWNDIATAFTKKNPHIKVDVQVETWDNVDEKVAQMVKAGHPPDVAQIGSYAAYAADGELYSADDLFPISVEADFIPSMAAAGSVERVRYGIPWVSSSRMFFYNKRLFLLAGIKTPPRTWADIEKDAVKLKDHGVQTPYGMPLGVEEAPAEAMMWLLGGQGGFTDTGGNYTFDSPANISTMTWIRKHLIVPGLVGPTPPAKLNRRDVFADFAAGKVGMLNGHPSLLTLAEAGGVDVGMAPLVGRDGPITNTLGVADWMMAFKKNGNKDADGKFLQFVYQQKNTVKFLDEYGLMPVTISASDAMQHDAKDADLVQFLNLLPEAVFYPVSKTSWGPVSDQIKKVIGGAVTGDPKAVLSGLQRYAQTQDGGN